MTPKGCVYIVGVGPGDPELITVKARRILDQADVVIYTGSLLSQELFSSCKPTVEIRDSAGMALPEILERLMEAALAGKVAVRVHDGDPAIFGALREQLLPLEAAGLECVLVPGVSSFLAGAAALKDELTIPELTQTVILTRMEGRTAVPEKEKLKDLAGHQATLILFLSAGLIEKAVAELKQGYPEQTPVAVVYKASRPDQKVIRGTLADIAAKVRAEKISMYALIYVGKVFDQALKSDPAAFRSKLYDEEFSHAFRRGRKRSGARQ
jgi:precorrin-4/cobalt-precorrin-4 C11-methyltransferase